MRHKPSSLDWVSSRASSLLGSLYFSNFDPVRHSHGRRDPWLEGGGYGPSPMDPFSWVILTLVDLSTDPVKGYLEKGKILAFPKAIW